MVAPIVTDVHPSSETVLGKSHEWVGPRPPIRYVHCKVCGIIKNIGRPNNSCKGPVKIGPRWEELKL